MSQTILVLVRDLLFSSKISATAQASGANIKLIRDPAKLTGETGDRLIVDLNQPGALEAGEQWKAATGSRVIGFVSHVDHQTIERARAAGIDAMPRSLFVQRLPDLLQ